MRNLPGQTLRVGNVVGVHAGQITASRHRQPGIERCGDALMGTAEHAQPGLSPGGGIQQGGAAVRGTVVHGQHFKGRQRRVRRGTLGPKAVQCRLQAGSGVVHGQDDGD